MTIKEQLAEQECLTELRSFMLEKTFSYGYSKWDLHLRSLLHWHRYEKIVDEVLRLVPQGFVLDVGCGMGQITEMLYLKGIKVVGIDIGGSIRKCEVWKHLHASLILGDAINLPFKSEMFDAVVCCGVLEHVYNERKFLEECRRVLKNKALFLCYFLPNKTGCESLFSRIASTGHKFYDKNSIGHLFKKCGYEVLTVTREHVIPQPHFSSQAPDIWNRLHKVLTLLDDALTKTPLEFFGDDWRVYARKKPSSQEKLQWV